MSTENENLAPDADLNDIEFAGNYTIPAEAFPDPVTDVSAATEILSEGYDPDAATTPAVLSTQELNPGSAVGRTALQAGVPSFLVLGLLVPEMIKDALETMGEVMPESVRLWLLGAAAVTTAFAAFASKVMAYPAVNAILREKFPALAPENKGS